MKFPVYLNIAVLLAGALFCQATASGPDEEPEIITEVAVQTGKITKATLHRYVMAFGLVEAQPEIAGKAAASSKVAAPMAGILRHVYCAEGQRVQKGALLFELDARSAYALIAKMEVAVEFAQRNLARKQQLRATGDVSAKLYDEAEQLLQNARKDLLNAKIQRELLRIEAPLSGTVSAIHFKAGEAVNLNTVMAELIDLARLDIVLRVPSRETMDIRIGQKTAISASSAYTWNNGKTKRIRRGSVTFVGSQVDPLTDTLAVRVSLGQDPTFKPGQFVSARIAVEERAGRLVAPIESVVTRNGVSTVALVEGSLAKQTVVTQGLRDGGLVEVTGAGLRDGMTIVTQGAYGLPAETRIRILR